MRVQMMLWSLLVKKSQSLNPASSASTTTSLVKTGQAQRNPTASAVPDSCPVRWLWQLYTVATSTGRGIALRLQSFAKSSLSVWLKKGNFSPLAYSRCAASNRCNSNFVLLDQRETKPTGKLCWVKRREWGRFLPHRNYKLQPRDFFLFSYFCNSLASIVPSAKQSNSLKLYC